MKIVEFLQEKPLSITAFVMAVANLLAVLDLEPFTDPDFVKAFNLTLSAFLGLFVTRAVTANKKIDGKFFGPYSGVG